MCVQTRGGRGAMRTRATCLLPAVLGLLVSGVPAFSQSQSSTPQARPTTAVSNSRLVIFDTDVGVFLVDNQTGRVWRYTRLTLSDSDIEPFVRVRESLRRTELSRELTTVERNELKATVKEERESTVNPCTGTGACFLEVDRARLTPDGWSSEIVKKQ
jgi:hypothetical protein